jgi:hypothetical protein
MRKCNIGVPSLCSQQMRDRSWSRQSGNGHVGLALPSSVVFSPLLPFPLLVLSLWPRPSAFAFLDSLVQFLRPSQKEALPMFCFSLQRCSPSILTVYLNPFPSSSVENLVYILIVPSVHSPRKVQTSTAVFCAPNTNRVLGRPGCCLDCCAPGLHFRPP